MVNKRKKVFSLFPILFVLSIIFISITLLSTLYLLEKPISKELYIQIPKKANSKMIIKIFNDKGLLRPKAFFLPILRMCIILTQGKINSGTYRFDKSNTNLTILRSILTGKQLSIVAVTFPEGITISDFAHIIKEKLAVDSLSFINETRKEQYRKKIGLECTNIEGYLHPDTYFFYYMESPSVIVERLIDQQNKIWKKRFEDISQKKGLSRHFVLTFASLIEAESPLPEEKPIISGVYWNRLSSGMRLESDPTVQYALGGIRRALTYKDLKVISPYNTYLYEGLPPTPINSPGISSIESALNPAKHDYYFFVSTGDGSGRHFFARTFAEHLKLKKKFKANRKISALKK
ncbi:MAG: endolytic transglycosylase MltG [Candidatus Kapaibacteriales bacterium]